MTRKTETSQVVTEEKEPSTQEATSWDPSKGPQKKKTSSGYVPRRQRIRRNISRRKRGGCNCKGRRK